VHTLTVVEHVPFVKETAEQDTRTGLLKIGIALLSGIPDCRQPAGWQVRQVAMPLRSIAYHS